MITKTKIIELSNKSGFKKFTLPIERDYLLNVIIFELYNTTFGNMLVFKGGTALKKVFFGNAFDSYRFSKDLDFNIMKDVSIDSIESMMSELISLLSSKYGLRFERIGKIGEGDYGYRSYSIKIKLKDRGYVFDENVRIKFDFAIRPGFDKPYEKFEIKNHYSEFFNEKIFCYCETLESILFSKFSALIGEQYRTEPKDLFDIVNIVNSGLVTLDDIVEATNLYELDLNDSRKDNIRDHWEEFFTDQLPYVPDVEKYLDSYDRIISIHKNVH